MTADHASRIKAQQQQGAELAAIKELEERTAPLLWAVYGAVLVVGLIFAIGNAAEFVEGYERRIDQLAQENAMLKADVAQFVDCLNGGRFDVDGRELTCKIRKGKTS